LVRRWRRRYIAFQLLPPNTYSRTEMHRIIGRIVSLFISEEKEAHIKLVRYYPDKGVGIIRCDHKFTYKLVNVITKGNGLPTNIKVKTLGTSGSIKTLKMKFLKS
jgi:RNase P/RNase MRP subunit POP5